MKYFHEHQWDWSFRQLDGHGHRTGPARGPSPGRARNFSSSPGRALARTSEFAWSLAGPMLGSPRENKRIDSYLKLTTNTLMMLKLRIRFQAPLKCA